MQIIVCGPAKAGHYVYCNPDGKRGDEISCSNTSQRFVAFDAVNGKPLWHSRIGNISNAPQTYLLDGKQVLLVAVGDMLYAFTIY